MHIQNQRHVYSLRACLLSFLGSIISNAQSPELRTYLAGQIARAITVMNVDEVVIFYEAGFKGACVVRMFVRSTFMTSMEIGVVSLVICSPSSLIHR